MSARGTRRRAAGRRLAPSTRKVGLDPGTVLYTGEPPDASIGIDVMVFGPTGCDHRRGVSLEEALAEPGPDLVRWIDVTGVHDAATLERIGSALGIHHLTLEDIAHVGQRPKSERFDRYLYLVMRMIRSTRSGREVPVVSEEQLSLILMPTTVVTFHERPGDVLDALRERIVAGRGRIRSLGSDYLAYAIADVVVDHYFHVLEHLSDALETLEDRAFDAVGAGAIDDVHALKRELLHVRRIIWPTRELLASSSRADDDLITPAVRTYLRDAHDHAVQVLETIEVLRETATVVHETYLAGLTLRMNEVMKLLTVIATIFIPLTFVVGVYGMNFEHMPELRWRWGYATVWLVMLLAALTMLGTFRRRRWI